MECVCGCHRHTPAPPAPRRLTGRRQGGGEGVPAELICSGCRHEGGQWTKVAASVEGASSGVDICGKRGRAEQCHARRLSTLRAAGGRGCQHSCRFCEEGGRTPHPPWHQLASVLYGAAGARACAHGSCVTEATVKKEERGERQVSTCDKEWRCGPDSLPPTSAHHIWWAAVGQGGEGAAAAVPFMFFDLSVSHAAEQGILGSVRGKEDHTTLCGEVSAHAGRRCPHAAARSRCLLALAACVSSVRGRGNGGGGGLGT